MSYTAIKSVKSSLLTVGLLAAVSSPVHAVDGVILIDQNKALAGNVTPGDAPGFPVTITQSGSYRLSGNLSLPDENTNGIEIRADNVSLDLNGFNIGGPGRPAANPLATYGPGHGVVSTFFEGGQLSNFKNTLVTNGSVSGVGANGINLQARSIVTKMRIHNNGGAGIVTRNESLVADNVVTDNRDAYTF